MPCQLVAGRLEIEQTSVPLEELVEGVCAMLDGMAMKSGVELTMFVDPELPREISGDPGRIRQVLVNLIGNAIKFSGGLGRRGRVAIYVRPKQGEHPLRAQGRRRYVE
jgi:two-component system, sensor histidine kinase and response regulator